MNAVVDFIYAHGWVIIGLLGFVIAVVYEILTKGLDRFLQCAMLRVQKWAVRQADVKGPELMEMVVSLAMTHVVAHWPAAVRQFVTEDWVRARAQWLYDTARDFLDDGKINESYKSNAPAR